jgi:hypothetical protein
MVMVKIEELKTNKNGDVRVAILTYKGEGDVVLEMNNELQKYVGDKKYWEFIDINMDNPWTRVVVFGELE